MGALVRLVAVQLSVSGLYLPPVFNSRCRHCRPRQSFRCRSRLRCELPGKGALVVLVAVQLSVVGIISSSGIQISESSATPDDHFAASPHCRVIAAAIRRAGRLVAVQLSVLGLYRPPLFKKSSLYPPQTIISLPVQTAV